MKTVKAQTQPGAVTVKRSRQPGRSFRTMRLMQERAKLLRCLLSDARLERCVQLVP